MKNVTNNFKEDIRTYGRQFDYKMKINNVDTDIDNINYIKPSFNSSLFKTIMHKIEIDSKIAINKGSRIDLQVGVKVNEDNYEYVSYNPYTTTKEPERQEDTLSYITTAYDKMVESMIEYDLTNSEDITVRNYLIMICERLGWNTNNIPATFVNYDKMVNPSLHQKIGYTFRDALDEIATITCSFLLFIGEDFYLIYPNETSEEIDESYLNEDSVKIGEKYFINSLVFSRAEESDNIYRKNETSIQFNGLHEYRISDNQLLSTNDRDIYIDEMFDYLKNFEFWSFDVESKGILFLDACDRFNFVLNGVTYSTILLNDEVNYEDGLKETLYTDEPEETETDYRYADITDKRINQTYLILDKQNEEIEAVVSRVDGIDGENGTVAKLSVKVGQIEGKISDATDTTITKESNTAKVDLEGINASEPITVKIRPLGISISYLYPRNNLYPSDDLFMSDRIIRFKNKTTNEIFDYELPSDLLYYDSENYDEFYLDYNEHICQIEKKVGYNADGSVYVLSTPLTEMFDYPSIELTDGDYEVSLPGYSNAYLFVRLMSKNIYTEQFVTRVESSTQIRQTVNEIDLKVDQKLTNYSTTVQMNSAIALKANEITSTVSQTYETKENATTNYSRLTQTANNIQTQVSNNANDISTINQTIDQVEINVGKKYNTSDFTNANITAKINDGTSNVQISANKIDLSGKTINMTSDNIKISSTYFSVDKNGNITATGGTIGGWTIGANSITASNGIYTVYLANASSANKDYLLVREGTPGNYSYPFYVRADGTMVATKATIRGTITADSGTFRNCTITNSCTVPASTITGTLATSNIPNLSASQITSGTLNAETINVTNLNASNMNRGSLSNLPYSFETGNESMQVSSSSTGILTGYRSGSRRWALASFTAGGKLQMFDSNGNMAAYFDQSGAHSSSDIRYKENIKDIDLEKSIKIITSLSPIEYTFKNQKDYHRGLSAQELEKTLKENNIENQIYEINKEGMYSINYVELIPDLINCIKYQQKEIIELKGK